MSEYTPSSELERPPGSRPGALDPELIEQVLADFRAWLQEAGEVPDAPVAAAPPDWSTVLQQWIALRQEVNLQTRASRAQLEQNAQALEELTRTVEALEEAAAQQRPDDDERLRPLLKSILDLHDAMTLGLREADRLLANRLHHDAPSAEPPLALPRWLTWLGLKGDVERAVAPLRQWYRSQLEGNADELEAIQKQLEALRVGYRMGLQRVERAIEAQGLERIPCVGEAFDPETMEVVEVVHNADLGSTEVVEDVRPGYLWRGRVLRFAQVRVARP